MAIPISMPEKKQDATSLIPTALGAAGSIVGSVYGGPVGGIAGGTLGSSLGQSLVGSQQNIGDVTNSPNSDALGSAQRRMSQTDNVGILQKGLDAANSDPNMSKEYTPIIQEALKRAQNKQMTGEEP